MKITLSLLRKIIREAIQEGPRVTCRVCGGEGTVAGEHCATCAGEGTELDLGATRGGIGRGPLPWRL